MLSEWGVFLQSIGCYEVTQPTFTYRRQGRRQNGASFYLRETIDFVAVSFDPLEWRACRWATVCRDDVPYPGASDHLPVELRVAKARRDRGREGATGLGRRIKPIPEWIFDDPEFMEQI